VTLTGLSRAALALVAATCWTAGALATQPAPPIPAKKPMLVERGISIAASFPGDPADYPDDGLEAGLWLQVPVPDEKPELPHLEDFAVLSVHDAALYARIFEAQRDADWQTADRLIAQLENSILMGHVLAERYLHPTGWLSSFEELSDWLARYADHPQAQRIYDLALLRRPQGAAAPAEPREGLLESFDDDVTLAPLDDDDDDGTDWSHLSSSEQASLKDLVAQIREDARTGEPAAARRTLNGDAFTRLADDLTFDRARAQVAHAYFIAGDDATAWELARESLERSGAQSPLAGWAAGLSAYRAGRFDDARRSFEILAAGNPNISKLVYGGAYWAARLNLMTGRPDKVRLYLDIAAKSADGFYGILAVAALGKQREFRFDLPNLSAAERNELTAMPEVMRAVALAEVGQQQLADLEFERVSAAEKPGLAIALLAVAGQLRLPATQYRFATALMRRYATRYEAALYPEPPWSPEGGFEIDPALVYAIMRQESHFEAGAKSRVGARGLMQIMPSTAAYIADDTEFKADERFLLDDPTVSVSLGQQYILHLLHQPIVNGNLFYMLTAYNAGPGNLEKWIESGVAADDPLLFVESIPSRETRYFVERVMANYWMYRLRLDGATPSLDMVASGEWPIYDDGELIRLAGD
jgi:soluble lytic murein transglycosylase-like protein